jgi:lipopolysaccharide/colanic/teichoic acid biosynthesis glycosyltransferase
MFGEKIFIFYLDVALVILLSAAAGIRTPLFAALPLVFLPSVYASRLHERESITEPVLALIRVLIVALTCFVALFGIAKLIGLGCPIQELAVVVTLLLAVFLLGHYGISAIVGRFTETVFIDTRDIDNEIFPVIEEIETDSRRSVLFSRRLPRPTRIRGGSAEGLSALRSLYRADEKLKDDRVPYGVRGIVRRRNAQGGYDYVPISVDIPKLAEIVLDRIPLPLVDAYSNTYTGWFRPRAYDRLKRLLDILVATILLVFFAPLMCIIALLILIEDGRPILFRHQRIGLNGKPFSMIKFRSLKPDGFDPDNPNTNIESRMLKIGGFIRKFRLDETPQLITVLAGAMSLVGPRPEMPAYHRQMLAAIPHYDKRCFAKPGITGWAQINFGHTSHIDDYRLKTEYDLYYVKRRGFFLDSKILLLTAETMIFGKGAR